MDARSRSVAFGGIHRTPIIPGYRVISLMSPAPSMSGRRGLAFLPIDLQMLDFYRFVPHSIDVRPGRPKGLISGLISIRIGTDTNFGYLEK